jgi:hypothetical protein
VDGQIKEEMNKIYLDILDSKRQEILKRLSRLLADTYYLAGGTALALQIRHRQSLDFDLFANGEVTFALKRRVLREFKDYPISTLVDTSDELSLVLAKEIKVSFINYFWDPLFALVKVPGSIALLSIKDISTTKAYALGRRGNYRDYFDLYVIVQQGHASLKDIIKWCSQKYAQIFSERMFLEQLTYFGDIKPEKHLKFLEEKGLSTKQMEEFFKKRLKSEDL